MVTDYKTPELILPFLSFSVHVQLARELYNYVGWVNGLGRIRNGDEYDEVEVYYCGHCDKEISKTKYYAHKRLYYNRSRKQWSQTKRLNFTDDLQVDPRG